MVVNTIRALDQGVEDVEGLIELAVEAEDEDTFNEAQAEANELEEKLAKLEFQRMFSASARCGGLLCRFTSRFRRYGSARLDGNVTAYVFTLGGKQGL